MAPVEAAPSSLAQLGRLVMLFRLLALNVAVFQLVGEPDRTREVAVGLLLAALFSFVPLRRWDQIYPWLEGRPYLLGIDLAISLSVYMALGPKSPFFLYTLGTGLLAGVLYRKAGAALFSVALVGGYYVVVITNDGGSGLNSTHLDEVQTLVTLPVLYPLAAFAGAAVRELLDNQASMASALRRAEGAAVADAERARVAREMHDSLGKTLYGIALAARGLAKRVEEDAPAAGRQARDLSGAAQIAAEEARGLISDLRTDSLTLPLGAALGQYVEKWSAESGVEAACHGEDVDLPNPGTRYELFCIVKEALTNVERHAQADHVTVELVQRGGVVVLSVRDDGVGLDGHGDPRAFEPDGHYGLVGMAERAERVGATVTMSGVPGRGTRVQVQVPVGDVRASEPWVVEGGMTR